MFEIVRRFYPVSCGEQQRGSSSCMVYGHLVTPPVRYGAKVISVDESEARQVAGYLQAVALDDPTGYTTGFVVAVADAHHAAVKAAGALKVEWNKGANKNVDSAALAKAAEALAENSAGENGHGSGMRLWAGAGYATWTTCVAEVSVNPGDGNFKIQKLTLVADVGIPVNPHNTLAQMQGALLWGLSQVLI